MSSNYRDIKKLIIKVFRDCIEDLASVILGECIEVDDVEGTLSKSV
jgi:hypothetical protein